MITLCIMIVTLVLWQLAIAWLMARTARAVGSLRGRLGFGLLAVVSLLAINVACLMIDAWLAPAASGVGLTVVILLVQLIATVYVLQRIFALSAKRSLVPLGASIAANLIFVGAVLFGVRPYLLDAFRFPTQDMSPTIETGDRFVVSKVIQPQRWDIVAYHVDGPQSAIFCKRLIGLPGERLRFDRGGVYINDQPVSPPAVLAGRCRAALPGSPRDFLSYRDGQTIVLGDEEYFFIGDNVDVSRDSRLTGPSHASSLVGVAVFTYWPPNKAQILRADVR